MKSHFEKALLSSIKAVKALSPSGLIEDFISAFQLKKFLAGLIELSMKQETGNGANGLKLFEELCAIGAEPLEVRSTHR